MTRRQSCPQRLGLRRMVVWLLAAALWAAAPAWAATPTASKAMATANAMAAKAKIAYDAADFAAAAHLYRQAFDADPARPGLLYSSARAAHRAALWELALQTYRAFLALAATAPDQRQLAQGHVVDVLRQCVRVALERAAATDHPAAAYAIARRATELDGDSLAAWWAAAQFAGRAGMQVEARQCYERIAALAPAGSPERAAAERWLAPPQPVPVAVTATGEPVAKPPITTPVQAEPVGVAAKVPVVTTAPARPSATSAQATAPSSWLVPASLGVLGAVALAIGGTQLKAAYTDEGLLDQQTNGHQGPDPIPLDYQTAVQRANAIAARKTWAATSVGVGGALVAAATAVWWRQRDARIAVAATGESVLATVVWQW